MSGANGNGNGNGNGHGVLTYSELRNLEMLLWRYVAHLNGDRTAATEDAAHRVLRSVAIVAGREQRAHQRQCSWCGKTHMDSHPHFCQQCVERHASSLL